MLENLVKLCFTFVQLTRLNRKAAERESDFVDFKECGEQIDLRRSRLASWITTVGFDRKAEGGRKPPFERV